MSAADTAPTADTTSSVTEALATYVSTALSSELPATVLEKTKHHTLDTIAAMVSGAKLDPGLKAISYIDGLGGTHQASVIATSIKTTAVNAALANGMLAHADETDDSHSASLCHPGCAVVAAALAVAESESLRGSSLLRAVALGYDVCARMNLSLHAYEFRDVGHSTHSIGPLFGAAAATAGLLELDVTQCKHMLSYAAQQASGIACWMRDTGHIEKAFDFGGMPARDGVTASTMVAHGFTGVDDVFGGDRNFFVAFDESARIGRAPEPGRLLDGLGVEFEIDNTSIKRFSVGSPIQAPLDAVLSLMQTHDFSADDVERVVVRIAHHGARTVNNRDMPDICLQHLCAVMLIDGDVTFASAHDDERMADPQVLEVRSKIELLGDDQMTQAMPSRQAIVEISLADGRVLSHHVTAVRGSAEDPMTRSEVAHKAHQLMADVLGETTSQRIIDLVWNLEDVEDLSELFDLLSLPG